MQLNSDTLSQPMSTISKQMRKAQRMTDSKARFVIQSLKVLLNKKDPVERMTAQEVLITVLQLQQKTYNLSAKAITDIWKIMLMVQLKLLYRKNGKQEESQNPCQNSLNLQQIYNKVLSNDFCQKLTYNQPLSDPQIIFKVWEKSFSLSDLRNLQSALLSLYIGWNVFFNSPNLKIGSVGFESLGFIEKSCMFLIKFSQKIKQSETFESLISLLKKMQQRFYKGFQKQIKNGIKQLKQTFKLAQTLNYSNFYLNTWQKLILARVVCISKRINKIQEINEVIQSLQILKQTYFFQRLINYSRNYRPIKKKSIIILSAQRLEYILFYTMVNLWVNSHILNQTISQNQENKNDKQQMGNKISLLSSISLNFIRVLIKRQITVLMVRQLIKKLQIVDLNYAVKQWKYVFQIMSLLLKQYPQNRTIIQFQNDNSYISKRFSPAIKFPLRIVLKLKGQSIPFRQQKIMIQLSDTNINQKIWVTMRNYEKDVMIFSFVKFVKNDIWGKEQKQFVWNQYQVNTIQITIESNRMQIVVNKDGQAVLSIENSFKKIDQIVLCDRQSGMGSTITQLFNFRLIQYSIPKEDQKRQTDLVCFIDPKTYSSSKDPMKQNLRFSNCLPIRQKSLVHLIETLGDLQLFMLILSHTLKKIKNQDQLLQMIRTVLNLMQQSVAHQEVQRSELTCQQKQMRRNSILCLCWFFAKQTKSVLIILQLMRFLYVRVKRDNQQLLKFLTNFSCWRQFKLQSQILLVMKIKQLFKESAKQEEKISYLVFCKKIMFDMLIYYKQSNFLMAEKQNCLKLHRSILETVYQQIKDILELTNRKNKYFMVQIFKFLQFLINILSYVMSRKNYEDGLDMTFAIQFTFFLRDISKLIFVSKERKNIMKLDIDSALESYYRKQQKQLIVPLSLNIQDAFEQRFNLYLTRITSECKCLITLFQSMTLNQEDTQVKIYPINSQNPVFCTQGQVNSNIVSSNIYLSMISEKSWNYIMFGMPLSQYTKRFCQDLWRVCFCQLFKQKRYLGKMCKMLQQTPMPQSEQCLVKIFEAVLFYPIYQKQYLYRLIKSQNFLRGVCPFKVQHLLLKHLNKLKPSTIDPVEQTQYVIEDRLQDPMAQNSQEQKIYYILLYSQNSDYQSCKQILESLRKRKMYENHKVIIHNILLQALLKFSLQRSPSSTVQAGLAQTKLSTRQQKLNQGQISQTCSISQALISGQQAVGSQMTQTSLGSKGQPVSKGQQIDNKPRGVNQNMANRTDLIYAGIEALNFYKGSFTYQHVKQFFKVESRQDIEALKLNFTLNVEGMIKALDIYKQSGQGYQFEKYSGFIQVYIKKFSQYLIFKRFPSFKPPNHSRMAEESNKRGRNKSLYKTVHVDLANHSNQFFTQLLKQRKDQLHSLSRVWRSQVQAKNKYFWSLFIGSEKYYSLSDITTELGQRLLLTITNEKPKIQLPKMITKLSLLHSVTLSLLSDTNDAQQSSQSSRLFQDKDFNINQPQETQNRNRQRIRKASNSHNKQIKNRKFKVLLINNDYIYQGFLFMTQKDSFVFQETYATQKIYNKICANPKERRDDDQVQKQPKCFQILIGQKSAFFFRKYLYFDAGLQIFSHQKQHFFCFDSDTKRNKFCSLYLKQHKVITYQTSKRQIKQESSKWVKGLISNYQYLMKINKYANRSPNDLSQYYVMPWTIVEFQQRQIDKAYLFQVQNFRDLKKPLGRIFQKKWKQIQQRFKSSFMNSKSEIQGGFGLEPFLYGSFYSNPAIVSSYMIRMQPFSTLHYHLQSSKIDVADRLFFQFSDQYRSIKTNLGDVKELTPEFYSNPQFLKNRAKLDLGSRQNKQIVNDVRLPKWANTAPQFAFKMKYFLQSPLVSKYLNYWIDLIFGVKAKRQNALSAHNLFMSQIYGPKQQVPDKKKQGEITNSKELLKQSKSSSIFDLENRIIFNKQFGQLPFTLFQSQHPQFQAVDEYYFFKGQIETLQTISEFSSEKQIQFIINQNFSLISSARTFQVYETSSQDHTQKQNWKAVSSFCSTSQLVCPKIVSGLRLSSFSPYLFYVKKERKKLCSRFMKKAKIFGTFQIKEEFQILDANVFSWLDEQVLIVGYNSSLKIYSFQRTSINQAAEKLISLRIQQTRPAISAKQFPAFTQHRGQIQFIQTEEDLKLIVSVDEMNKLFLLKYFPDRIEVINNFQVKSCYMQQKVIKVLVHKMSLIVCLTSYNRLLTYSFYGDLIGCKEISFRGQQGGKIQQASCIAFFNKQTSELLMGTNLGNIWKVDLFQFYKTQERIHPKQLWFEKICINTKQHQFDIKAFKVKRYGRHWQIYTVSYDQAGRKVVSKVRCLTLKNITFNLNK